MMNLNSRVTEPLSRVAVQPHSLVAAQPSLRTAAVGVRGRTTGSPHTGSRDAAAGSPYNRGWLLVAVQPVFCADESLHNVHIGVKDSEGRGCSAPPFTESDLPAARGQAHASLDPDLPIPVEFSS